MKTPSPNQLMESHVRMNLGVYFSDSQAAAQIGVATSKAIKDFYWNYAYSLTLLAIPTRELPLAIELLERSQRAPAIWQQAENTVPDGWSVQSREAWMWQVREDWKPDKDLTAPTELEIRLSSRPTETMRDVFQDAYGSGVAEGSVGYYELPVEYSRAYLDAEARPPARICQLSLWKANACLAIASSCVNGNLGGIYSVATTHNSRNRGYGRLISQHATNWAFNNGAEGVFLQTPVASPVERLYSTIGFRTIFVGELLTLG
jgi:GNAT superfamily N-acetyltransferase